jgi:hypothetical protein
MRLFLFLFHLVSESANDHLLVFYTLKFEFPER